MHKNERSNKNENTNNGSSSEHTEQENKSETKNKKDKKKKKRYLSLLNIFKKESDIETENNDDPKPLSDDPRLLNHKTFYRHHPDNVNVPLDVLGGLPLDRDYDSEPYISYAPNPYLRPRHYYTDDEYDNSDHIRPVNIHQMRGDGYRFYRPETPKSSRRSSYSIRDYKPHTLIDTFIDNYVHEPTDDENYNPFCEDCLIVGCIRGTKCKRQLSSFDFDRLSRNSRESYESDLSTCSTCIPFNYDENPIDDEGETMCTVCVYRSEQRLKERLKEEKRKRRHQQNIIKGQSKSFKKLENRLKDLELENEKLKSLFIDTRKDNRVKEAKKYSYKDDYDPRDNVSLKSQLDAYIPKIVELNPIHPLFPPRRIYPSLSEFRPIITDGGRGTFPFTDNIHPPYPLSSSFPVPTIPNSRDYGFLPQDAATRPKDMHKSPRSEQSDDESERCFNCKPRRKCKKCLDEEDGDSLRASPRPPSSNAPSVTFSYDITTTEESKTSQTETKGGSKNEQFKDNKNKNDYNSSSSSDDELNYKDPRLPMSPGAQKYFNQSMSLYQGYILRKKEVKKQIAKLRNSNFVKFNTYGHKAKIESLQKELRDIQRDIDMHVHQCYLLTTEDIRKDLKKRKGEDWHPGQGMYTISDMEKMMCENEVLEDALQTALEEKNNFACESNSDEEYQRHEPIIETLESKSKRHSSSTNEKSSNLLIKKLKNKARKVWEDNETCSCNKNPCVCRIKKAIDKRHLKKHLDLD